MNKYIIEEDVYPRITHVIYVWETLAESEDEALENVRIGEDCATILEMRLKDHGNCDYGKKRLIKKVNNVWAIRDQPRPKYCENCGNEKHKYLLHWIEEIEEWWCDWCLDNTEPHTY